MYKIGIAYSNKKYNSVLNGQGKVNGKKQRNKKNENKTIALISK